MNRRRFLAAAGGGLAAGAATTLGVRLSNVRYYDPNGTVAADLPPGERIFAAARLLSVLDHRAVSRVTVLEDGTDSDPYRRSRYRYEWRPSRHRYLFVASTFAPVPGNPPPTRGSIYALLHHTEATDTAADETLPVATVAFASARRTIYDPLCDPPETVDARPRIDDERRRVMRGPGLGQSSDDRPPRPEAVLSAAATWTQTDETETTVTYETDSREDYVAVPPLVTTATAVGDGSTIAATLDRETGRLLELDDRRVVEQETEDGRLREYTYRIETTVDQYGTVTAPEPDGPVPDASLPDTLEELLSDATLY